MRRVFLFIFSIFVSIVGRAQDIDEVTLVANGMASTKEEATHIALRSAIEQAFGVFVSANTSIVNDELVKDEIATVASGNVKSYTELESVILPNNMCMVTLQAVVSTQKLVAYAKSKGSSCEFAGATLMANRKLMLLNKTNTAKAFENMIFQLEELAPFIFDYKLNVGEPSLNTKNSYYIFPITLTTISNENTERFVNLLSSTLSAVAISDVEAIDAERILGEKMFKMDLNKTRISDISPAYNTDTQSRLYFYTQFDVARLEEIIDVAMNGIEVKDNLGVHYSMPTSKHVINLREDKWIKFWDSPHFGVQYIWRRDGNYEDAIWVELPDFSKPQPLFKSKKNSLPQPHKPVVISTSQGRISVPIQDVDKLTNFEVSRKQNLQFPSQVIAYLNENGILENLAEEIKGWDYGETARFINYKNHPYLVALAKLESRPSSCLMKKKPLQLLREVVMIEADDEVTIPYKIIGDIVGKLLVKPDQMSVEDAKFLDETQNWVLYDKGYEYIAEDGDEYVAVNRERRRDIITGLLSGVPVKEGHYKDWNLYFIDVYDICDEVNRVTF